MKNNKKLLETILNPHCSENILIEASKDNENYFSSRVRKAVALHKNTPKEIIDKLLMDEYRWVREAAASNSKITIKEIDNLFEKYINTKDTEVCDRYVLKGLSLNPNIDLNKRKRIKKILRSGKHLFKNKFPVEYDNYEILSEKCTIDENFLDIFSLNNFIDISSDGDRLDLDLIEEWIFDSEGDILKGEKIINNSKTILKNIDGDKINIPIQGNSSEDEILEMEDAGTDTGDYEAVLKYQKDKYGF